MSQSSEQSSECNSTSQDTNSTTVLEDSYDISFENVNFSVTEFARRGWIWRRERKTILHEISGSFNAGELSVIMGQSGSGKTILMDILAGYTKPTSGSIKVKGMPRIMNTFRRRSCYILQDCMLLDQLTIKESLNIAADLKLGNHIDKKQKKQRINQIISSLGLSEAKNTRAGSLSGGQKKRLAIGLELVNDPSIMFLDEPTSGLDSSMSKQIIYLLHILARQGRTVVVTLHQPSAALLDMADRLYAMVSGSCAYIGSSSQLLPYLEQIELRCPSFHNPVEYLIEKSAENKAIAENLIRHCKNGKSLEWTTHLPQEIDNRIEKLFLTNQEKVAITILPQAKENPTNKVLLALKNTYSTSNWKQFTTLTKRAVLSMWRNRSFTVSLTMIHIAMAIFVGWLCFNIGQNGNHVVDNFNFLFFCLQFLMFTAFSVVTSSFPGQIPMVRREHFNRWYTTGSYFSSAIVSILPTQTICTLLFAGIVFSMTGQLNESDRLLYFCLMLLLVSYIGSCKGILIAFSFNVKNAGIFGPLFILPFIIFSGFFLHLKDTPYFMKWIFELSFLKHGLVGLVETVFGMERSDLNCHIPDATFEYCHYKNMKTFLIDYGFRNKNDSFTKEYSQTVHIQSCLSILAIGCVVLLGAFVILKIRLKHKW